MCSKVAFVAASVLKHFVLFDWNRRWCLQKLCPSDYVGESRLYVGPYSQIPAKNQFGKNSTFYFCQQSSETLKSQVRIFIHDSHTLVV